VDLVKGIIMKLSVRLQVQYNTQPMSVKYSTFGKTL